jgi:hypothetical protein
MKIEDIKPGDVIVRTEDKILFKVVEVTSDRQIMQSANCKLNDVFCIFQEPKPIAFCSVYEFELATEEQRQYMDSKLAAFNGTHTDAESNRITALASIIGDPKKYNALAERIKKLTDDMQKQFDAAKDELQKKDEEHEALEQKYSELLKKHTVLFYKNDALLAELPKVGDRLEQLQDNNYMLRKQLNTANANCKESEEKRVEADEKVKEHKNRLRFVFRHYRRFIHADFVSIGYDCPHNPGVEVGGLSCVNCAHFLKNDFYNSKHVLCAYDYDKEKQ